jgi:CRP-like cAMP-binding protein
MTDLDLARMLADHSFLAELDSARADALTQCARLVRFEPGERIIAVDDPADRFWLLHEGTVDLELHGAGRGTLVIARLQPDDLLGVSWIASPYQSRFDAIAGDAVTAVEFDAVCVRSRCDDDPELGYQLFRRFAQLMGERLQATRLQLLDIYGAPT